MWNGKGILPEGHILAFSGEVWPQEGMVRMAYF